MPITINATAPHILSGSLGNLFQFAADRLLPRTPDPKRMPDWSAEDWRRWFTAKGRRYYLGRQKNTTHFLPFQIEARSCQDVAIQIHNQLSNHDAAVRAAAAAGARAAAIGWDHHINGVETGHFYMALAGLCGAQNLPEMLRDICAKLPLSMSAIKLQKLFVALDHVLTLDNMTREEIACFKNYVRKRWGEKTPEAFLGPKLPGEDRGRSGLEITGSTTIAKHTLPAPPPMTPAEQFGVAAIRRRGATL